MREGLGYMSWQPIETMPRNKECIVWCSGAECIGVAWKSKHGDLVMPEPQAIGYDTLTHWFLPDPPNSQNQSHPKSV